MSPDLFIPLGALLATLMGALGAFLVRIVEARSRKGESKLKLERGQVALLLKEVSRLHRRVECLEEGYERERKNTAKLQDYVSILRKMLIELGATPPEMPRLE